MISNNLKVMGPGETSFPCPSSALTEPNGLIAIGGDLSCEQLISAYQQGIFPWFEDEQGPVLWWSPTPRAILYPTHFKCSRSLKKSIKKHINFGIDQAFTSVIQHCAQNIHRQEGSWITETMIKQYQSLFKLGIAHSIEVYNKEQLVGGLYGLSIGSAFYGESMFHLENNGAKMACYALCQFALEQKIAFIDCQIPNDFLKTLGAIEIPRDDFLKLNQKALASHNKPNWQSPINLS